MNIDTIDELEYIEEMRQRLGLEPDDTSYDQKIISMTPVERVRLIAGWYHGDNSWADIWQSYFESQGLYLTSNQNADGIIKQGE